jgi:hypothetical protein
MSKGLYGGAVASVGHSVMVDPDFVTVVGAGASLILARREGRAAPISLTGFIPVGSTMTTLDQPGVSKILSVKA